MDKNYAMALGRALVMRDNGYANEEVKNAVETIFPSLKYSQTPTEVEEMRNRLIRHLQLLLKFDIPEEEKKLIEEEIEFTYYYHIIKKPTKEQMEYIEDQLSEAEENGYATVAKILRNLKRDLQAIQ